MTEQPETVRAGFWRRVLALLVDCIVVILLLQILAMLFQASNGRVIQAFSLDWLFLPLLLVMRWLMDRDVGSPGRLAVNTRLALRFTDSRAPFAKRYALFALIFLPAYAVEAWWTAFGDFRNETLDFAIAAAVSALTLGVLLIGVVIPIIRGRDAFYDRRAGTMVVRDKQTKG